MVTYKFLSQALDVHVNTAKQMLWSYKESKQGACKGVVYFVSGLVSEEFVETRKKYELLFCNVCLIVFFNSDKGKWG